MNVSLLTFRAVAAPRLAWLGRAALLVAGLGLAASASAQTAGRAVWSLRVSHQDSVGQRQGLTGAPATLRRYVVSNGSTPTSGTTAPAYSSSRGQALAPGADGSGWTASNGGPGTFPVRTFYQQFVVTATAATRLDSLIFSAVAASSAGGRVALQYSRSGFASDSASFSGGRGPAYAAFTSGSTSYPASPGGVLPAANDGSFPTSATSSSTSAILPQFVSGTVNNGTFRLAFNGPTGVTLAAGQTLTVRLYFAINSSNPGRYVFLRDVQLKGNGTTTATRPARAKDPLAAYPNPGLQDLTIDHPAATSQATVAVYSLTGQRVALVAARPGTTATHLHLDALTPGLYVIEYAAAQHRLTTRVTKQ